MVVVVVVVVVVAVVFWGHLLQVTPEDICIGLFQKVSIPPPWMAFLFYPHPTPLEIPD